MVDLDNTNTCKSLRYNQAPGRFPRYVITNHRLDQSLDQFIPICSPLSYGVARSIKLICLLIGIPLIWLCYLKSSILNKVANSSDAVMKLFCVV